MGLIMLKSKTVLLVSLDTTRTDVLFSGKFPFIEKKIKESITFKNAVVSAPLNPIRYILITIYHASAAGSPPLPRQSVAVYVVKRLSL